RHGEDAGADLAGAQALRRAPRARPRHLAAQDQDAPVRGVLARHQGDAGHHDVRRRVAGVPPEVAVPPRRPARPRAGPAPPGPALERIKRGDAGGRAAYVKSLELFAQRMADVLEVEAPDVVLAEGAPAMNGDGFEKMLPISEPVAIGGTNVIRVDRVGAAFLG